MMHLQTLIDGMHNLRIVPCRLQDSNYGSKKSIDSSAFFQKRLGNKRCVISLGHVLSPQMVRAKDS